MICMYVRQLCLCAFMQLLTGATRGQHIFQAWGNSCVPLDKVLETELNHWQEQ